MLRRLTAHACRVRPWLLTLLLGGGLAASFCVTRRAVPPTVGASSPALAAVMVALGGSRGILAEILWWRLADLQQQNRYAEMLPLTELLVTLEPTSADAWAYNAWNLAYNLSAAHRDAAEKWRWVKRGVTLLKRGLGVMPRSVVLLRQMGWLWEDKLGGTNDEAVGFYRAHLAELPPPDAAETAAFAQRIHLAEVDWMNPRLRALYWYCRADHEADQLRVLTALLREPGGRRLLPYFREVLDRAWPDLAPIQQEQVTHFLATLPPEP